MDYTDDQMESYFTQVGITQEERTPEQLKTLIQCLDACHLHKDVAIVMKYRIYHCAGDLNEEERKILISNCKELLTHIRTTWQDIQSTRFSIRTDPKALQLVMMCVPWLVREIVNYCQSVVKVLDKALSKVNQEDETAVISYVKTKADYYRYLVEVDMNETVLEESEKCYSEAWKLAQKLSPCDFCRLSIALNFSVFYYEIKKDKDAACKLAFEAQKNARECREDTATMDPKALGRTDMILKLIEENYMSWTKRESSYEDEGEMLVDQVVDGQRQ